MRSNLLTAILERLAVNSGPDADGDYIAWCVFHPDGRGEPPHRANLHVNERGFRCFACNEYGSLAKLAEYLGIDCSSVSHSREPTSTYDYCDESGDLLFQVVRQSPKGFFQRRPDGRGGWINNVQNVRIVPYRFNDLAANPEATVWIVEGEKDADRLAGLGLIATTNPMGAGTWRPELNEALTGRDVVIIPDNDEPGRRHAQQVATSLHGVTARIRVLDLPGLPEKGDVSDWLDAGHGVSELEQLRDACCDFESGSAEPSETTESQRPRDTQADRLVTLANEVGLELFVDELSEEYARIRVDDHWELHPVDSKHLRSWLTHQYYRIHEHAPNLTALKTAVNTLSARARFDGTPVTMHNRVAWHDDAVYYDLADARWRAVRITGDGWELVHNVPPLFRRYKHQNAQVDPVHGGDLDELFEIVNISDPQLRLLFKVYLVSCLIPEMPHPICFLHGPQGSSKSTTSRLLRQLVDPSVAPITSLPNKREELIQSLAHNWMATYDNINGLPGWVSDTLCRAVTGEGDSKRALYTNDDDVIQAFRRTVLLNGINVAGVKPDYLDRCIIIGLERVTSTQRRSESDLYEWFASRRGRLVGAMFSVLSEAMRRRTEITPEKTPRMADFAHYGMAISAALGHPPEKFSAAYNQNINRQHLEVVNAHPLATVLMLFMDTHPQWEGRASELLVMSDLSCKKEWV